MLEEGYDFLESDLFKKNKKLMDDTYLLFISHIDSLNAIDKYQGDFRSIQEIEFLRYKDKSNDLANLKDEIILSTIIEKYKIEGALERGVIEKGGKIEELKDRINKLIENNEKYQFFNEHLIHEENSFSSDHPYLQKLIVALNANKNIIEREKIQMRNNQLKNIISSLENFVSNMYYYHYNHFNKDPNLFEDEKISYNEISRFENLDSIKEYISEKKVINIMFNSFNKWLKSFIDKCTKDNYDKKFKHDFEFQIETLSEAFQRRHLVTHNNSRINHIYLENVSDIFTKDLKSGDVIISDEKYIKNIIETTKIFSLELFKRFIQRSTYKNTYFTNLLNSSTLEMINDGDFDYATTVLKSIKEIADLKSDQQIIQYNLFICSKLSPTHEFNVDECTDYFEGIEELEPDDIVAKKILLKEEGYLDYAIKYLKDYEVEYQINMIYTWPLFKLIENEAEYVEYKNEVLYHDIKGGD